MISYESPKSPFATHQSSAREYPTHWTRYSLLSFLPRQVTLWSKISSTSHSSVPSTSSSPSSASFSPGPLWYLSSRETWNTLWIDQYRQGSLSLYACFPTLLSMGKGPNQRCASFLLSQVVLMFFANNHTISLVAYQFSRCLLLQYFVCMVFVQVQFSSSSFLRQMICLALSLAAGISPPQGSSSIPQRVSRFILQQAQLGDILIDSWQELLYANSAKCSSLAQSSQCQLQQIRKNPLMPQFQRSICPLVQGWKAVKSFLQTLRQKQNADQNLLVNTLPRSNTMSWGMP